MDRLRQMCFRAGLAGGAVGGMVGLGGGVVMVPMMTRYAGLTQHQAVGTSSAAVAGTGLAGLASFGSAGAVDFGGAAAIGLAAMLTARAGALFTGRFNQVQMQRAFAYFQLVVAPMVPFKAYFLKQKQAEAERGSGSSSGRGSTNSTNSTNSSISSNSSNSSNSSARSAVATAAAAIGFGGVHGGDGSTPSDGARTAELLQLALVGSVAGFASGMFGIGGGVVLTPALCLLTELPHATILGTTLASMVPPSLIGAFTHYRMGNMLPRAALPLCIGSAIGASVGGQVAVRTPEEPLQILFALVIGGMGGRTLFKLRGK